MVWLSKISFFTSVFFSGVAVHVKTVQPKQSEIDTLCDQCTNGNVEAVQKIVQSFVQRGGAKRDLIDGRHSQHLSTPVMFGAQNNKIDVVKWLISNDANLSLEVNTALDWVVKSPRSFEMVKLLVENGCPCKNLLSEGLGYVPAAQLLDFVKLAISKGASVNAQDSFGCTLLHMYHDRDVDFFELTRLLLQYNPDLTILDQDGRNVLFAAVKIGGQLAFKLTQLLINRGADAKVIDYEGWNLLMHHIVVGNPFLPELAESLLQKGEIDIDYAPTGGDYRGDTAVMIAASYEGEFNAEVVTWLVNRGANVNLEDCYGKTLMYYAIYHDKTDACKFLIENGFDVDYKNKYNETAMHHCAVHHNVEVMDLLLKKGGEKHLMMRDSQGRTPVDIILRGMAGWLHEDFDDHDHDQLVDLQQKYCKLAAFLMKRDVEVFQSAAQRPFLELEEMKKRLGKLFDGGFEFSNFEFNDKKQSIRVPKLFLQQSDPRFDKDFNGEYSGSFVVPEEVSRQTVVEFARYLTCGEASSVPADVVEKLSPPIQGQVGEKRKREETNESDAKIAHLVESLQYVHAFMEPNAPPRSGDNHTSITVKSYFLHQQNELAKLVTEDNYLQLQELADRLDAPDLFDACLKVGAAKRRKMKR